MKLSPGKGNPHEAPEEHFMCQGEMKPEELNLLILGGDTGGTIAARTFVQRGQRVAVIVIHSSKVASYLRRNKKFGIAKRDVG